MKQYDVLMAACYEQFSCKGGACRHNCCSEWLISMSRDEYRKLKRKIPDLKEKICLVEDDRRTEETHYRMILDKDGCCPFLTEDKLCCLQAKYGPGILSNTCSSFPRFYQKHLGKLEYCLSLGCEKVLELLLEEREGIEISSRKEARAGEPMYSSAFSEKSKRTYPVVSYYYDIKTLCLCLLQAKDVSLEDRIILLGMAIRHIDSLVCEHRETEIPDYISQYLDKMEDLDTGNLLQDVSTENIGVLYYNLVTATRSTGMDDRHYKNLAKQIREKLQATVDIGISIKEDGIWEGDLNFDLDVYRSCQKQFNHFREEKDYYLENCMVAYLLYSDIPFKKLSDGVWKNFTYFAWVYSMLKFTLTTLLEPDSTDEELINYCVILFRKLGHSNPLYEEVTNSFIENVNDSLAHMVVLLKS